MTNPPVPATPLDVEACSLCGRPLTWNESDTLKAWVCHNCPGTPSEAVDVEACVQLLDDLILMLAPHDAQSIADANQLRALKLALPGMGKAEERLRQIREQCRVIYYGTTDMYPIEHAPGANKDSWEWMMLHLDADAARAAQPEETSDAG